MVLTLAIILFDPLHNHQLISLLLQEISSLISGQLSSSDVESCEEELAALLAAEKGEAEEIRLPEAPTGEIQGMREWIT